MSGGGWWDERWRRRLPWIGIGVVAAMMMAVWERSHVVSLGYEVSELRHTRQHELQQHRALLLESASLASLDRIERLATERLGLVPAAPGQITLVQAEASARPSHAGTVMTGTKPTQLARVERSQP